MSKVHCCDLFQGLEARPGFDLTGLGLQTGVILLQRLREASCSPGTDLEQRLFEDFLHGLKWDLVPIVEPQ